MDTAVLTPAELMQRAVAADVALTAYREAMVEQKSPGAALTYCHGFTLRRAARTALPKPQLVRPCD